MNERSKWFKINEDGTRTIINAIDPKTNQEIPGSGQKAFDDCGDLIVMYCGYMGLVCLASAIMVWHRGFTFNCMSEKIA